CRSAIHPPTERIHVRGETVPEPYAPPAQAKGRSGGGRASRWLISHPQAVGEKSARHGVKANAAVRIRPGVAVWRVRRQKGGGQGEPSMPRKPTETPDAVDVHVGERVRAERARCSLSQSELGAAIG